MGRPSEGLKKACRNCGNLFSVKPSRYERTIFCNSECMTAYRKKFSKEGLLRENKILIKELEKIRENLLHPDFGEGD